MKHLYQCEICEKIIGNEDRLVAIQDKWFCHTCLYNIAKNSNRKAINAAIVKMLGFDCDEEW